MRRVNLSFNTRKSLCNQLGDDAGNEIADFIQQMAGRIQILERNKVDVTPVVPVPAFNDHLPETD